MIGRVTLAMSVLALGLALASEVAAAAPSPPADLRLDGGSEAWRPQTRFRLRWSNPTDASPPVAAVHYVVEGPTGSIAIPEVRIAEAAETVELQIPRVPGIYTAEVWLEDGEGADGPPASTQLRYDDARPGSVAPLSAPEWIGRSAFPLTVAIGHPEAPLPVSGILGYAISIDGDPLGIPCEDSFLCTPMETDLHGGIEDDSLRIPQLPDGVSYVHAVAVSAAGVRSAAVGHRQLRVDTTDPSTQIDGVPSGWTSRPVGLVARASDSESGMAPSRGAFTAIRLDQGAPVTASGDEVQATVIPEGAHSVAYYARDAAGNVNDGSRANAVTNRPPGIATVRIDRTPPRVAFLNSLDPEDPEQIRAQVEDSLSGGSTVNGSIAVRAAGSGDAFEALPTEASPVALHAMWDSDAYPPGAYEFRAVASDAAGNVATSTARADGGTMVVSNPIKAPTVLAAGFDGKRRPLTRALHYGRGIRFGGRLTTGSRRPIEDASVRITERYPGDGRDRTTTVVTADRGAFSVQLPVGPSREVIASFAGSRAFAASSSRPTRLLVRSGVRLRVSAPVAAVGGPPVVFRGVVKAGPGELPDGGKSVELQFRLPGLPWQEFRTVQTDRRGRFRYAYRFSDDDSRGVRFQFRAHAAAQGGWPYEPGDSRPVAVRGR